MNNIIMVIIALLAILILTLIPQAIAQEKIMIFVHCFDCPSDEYLLKVFEPIDNPNFNPKLIGEKKFTSEDLINITDSDEIYLDNKFTGKKLDFELISLTSGLSSSKSVYIVDEVQGIDRNPVIHHNHSHNISKSVLRVPDGRESYCYNLDLTKK